MQLEPLMREFAILIGRALARRWIQHRDRIADRQSESDPDEGDVPGRPQGDSDSSRWNDRQ